MDRQHQERRRRLWQSAVAMVAAQKPKKKTSSDKEMQWIEMIWRNMFREWEKKGPLYHNATPTPFCYYCFRPLTQFNSSKHQHPLFCPLYLPMSSFSRSLFRWISSENSVICAHSKSVTLTAKRQAPYSKMLIYFQMHFSFACSVRVHICVLYVILVHIYLYSSLLILVPRTLDKNSQVIEMGIGPIV